MVAGDVREKEEQPVSPPAEEPMEADWIAGIEENINTFRDAMADVAREADEGMIDGPLGKVFVFLKRYWAAILAVLLPFVPAAIGHWADNNPFPAVPEIITEQEFQQISDYIVYWSNTYEYAMNWMIYMDRDGDGVNDVKVHAFDYPPDPERTELYIHTKLELPSVWKLLSGKCGIAPQGEEMALQDEQTCLIITIEGETKGDRSELRQAVDATLAAIEQEKAEQAAGTYVPPQKPELQEMIDLLLENQQE